MEEILEGHVRRKALLPKSKPTLFLYEGDSQKHSKMIGNVRYVTVSHYSGDKNIFEKVGELITRDFHSAEPDKVTNEISVGLSTGEKSPQPAGVFQSEQSGLLQEQRLLA